MINRFWTATALSLIAVCAAAGRPGEAADPAYGFTILHGGVTGELAAGKETVVHLEIRNDGTLRWTPEERFHVAYHWTAEDGATVVWDGLRTDLPGPVAAQSTVEVEARIRAPAGPGTYLLQWDLVREGACWFSQRMEPAPPSVTIRVVAARPEHAFSVASGTLPHWVWAGEPTEVRLALRNDGTRVWRPDDRINVSYHWLTGSGSAIVFDGKRTRVGQEVAPGEQVEVRLEVVAPHRMGPAFLHVDMVHEGVCWFAQQDPTPQRPVRVWIVPGLAGNPAVPLALVTLLAAAVICIRRRQRAATGIVAAAALADLAWMLVSLTSKQRAVLDAAGRLPAAGSRWVVVSGIAVLALLLLAVPQRVRPWLVWTAVLGLSFVIFSDVVYMRYFGDVISVAALAAGRQVGDVHASIAALVRPGDLWLAADLVPGGLLAWAVAGLRPRPGKVRTAAAVVLALALVPGARMVWQAEHARQGRFVQVFQSVFVIQEVGVINYHLADLWSTLRSSVLRPPLGEERRLEVEAWFRERRPLRRGSGPFFGVARGMNLLMIQVESMQRFVIGLEVGGQEVTPNLNRWLPAMAWFPRVTDQTSQGRTSDGEVTTQTSLLPLARGALVFPYAGNHFVGLPAVFREHHYQTLSAVPFQPTFWNRQLMHPAFGYSENLFADAFRPGEKIGWGLNDRDFLLQMEERLTRLPQPFCAWLITLSLHHPFEGFPDHLEELDVGKWEGTPFGNYLHTMHFFDASLREMVDRMAADGLLDDTVVVIWGDHDAGFVWRPDLAEAIGIPHTEAGWYTVDAVPLLIRVPGSAGPRGRFDAVGGQTDVAPTLAALFGIDPENVAWVGRNLLGEPGDGPMPRPYGSWISDHHLYANHGPALSDGVCYDARTLERLPVTACAAGDAAARRQVEIADLVVRYDLQQELSNEMSERESGGQ